MWGSAIRRAWLSPAAVLPPSVDELAQRHGGAVQFDEDVRQVLEAQVQHGVRDEQTAGSQRVGDVDLPVADFAQGRAELGVRLKIAGERDGRVGCYGSNCQNLWVESLVLWLSVAVTARAIGLGNQ